VQSTEVGAFDEVASDLPSALSVLRIVADHLAIAIHNAQLLQELDKAGVELLRNKTFEAIATATGEAIHWVGNKAAPIPGSARRVREDLRQLLAMFKTLLAEPVETRAQHPFWPVVEATFDVADAQGFDLEAMAQDLVDFDPEWLQLQGGLESILEDGLVGPKVYDSFMQWQFDRLFSVAEGHLEVKPVFRIGVIRWI